MQTYPRLSECHNSGPCRSFHISRNMTTRTECCIFHICQNVFNSAKCNISQHVSESDNSVPTFPRVWARTRVCERLSKSFQALSRCFVNISKYNSTASFLTDKKSESSASVNCLFMLPCPHEENRLCVVRTIWQAHCDPANASHQFRAASGHLWHLDPPQHSVFQGTIILPKMEIIFPKMEIIFPKMEIIFPKMDILFPKMEII